MGKFIDLTGKTYGRLTVVSFHGIVNKRPFWLCRCECGKYKSIVKYSLTNGDSKSCGCLSIEITRARGTHGETNKTKEYKTWAEMKYRCSNKRADSYHLYGGRGISVCDRWKNSYENFLADMGRAPTSKHSLDRIRVNENYGPENCRWATQREQQNNRRNTRYITLDGVTKSINEWSRELGLNYHTLSTRLGRGWNPTEALKESIRFHSKSRNT